MDTTSVDYSFEEGSTAPPMKTIVSFVISDGDTCTANNVDGDVSSTCEEREDKKHASNSASIFLSMMYATIIVLIGIVFPVSEALLDSWQSDTVVAGFMIYLLVGSTVVLIWFMIKNKKRPAPGTHSIGQENNSMVMSESVSNVRFSMGSSDNIADHLPNQRRRSRYASESYPNEISARKLSTESGLGLEHSGSRGSVSAIAANPNLRHVTSSENLPYSTYVPWDSSSNTTPESASPNLRPRRRAYSIDSIISESDDQTIGTMPGSDLDVAHYIALKTQTASLSHEGTSFYLRFGCLIFSVSYFMYLVLEMEYYFTTHESDCYPNTRKNILVIGFQLVFVLVQTFFLFKTQNLYITSCKPLVRLGLMHVFATNLVVWIRALVLEVVEGVHEAHTEHADHAFSMDATTPLNEDTTMDCSTYEEPITIKATAYLFPCILEYSLIASATMAVRFKALDIRVSGEVLKSIKKYLRKAKKQVKEGLSKPTPLAQEHHHDKMLDKAHTGLYGGILVFTGTIIAFIMFIYCIQSEDLAKQEEAILIYDITDLGLCVVAFVAITIGVFKIRNFSYSLLRENEVDHFLLLISFCGLTIYELFQVVCFFYHVDNGEVNNETVLGAVSSLLTIIEALFQVAFIIFGMQLYSHSPEQRLKKPARGIITFLIITNLSFWVIKSFGEGDVSTELMESFFGVTAWQIILHFNLPFMLFFRFHSSVCLADMWTSAYENEESPVQYVNID